MKKALMAVLLAFALLLGGCGANAVPAQEAAPAPEETPVPVSEPAEPSPTPEEIVPTPEPDPLEKARELIRAGSFAEAGELLASLPQDGETAALRLRAALGDPQAGDLLSFGRYEQNNKSDDGPEPIEWVVLTREGDRVMLLSLYALDSMPYHDVHYGNTTWKDCALRAWLNTEFLEAAFDETELCLLAETVLQNPDNEVYGTPGGEDTADRVFLLSCDEARAYVLGTELAMARVTDYGTARGGSHIWDGMGWWWLRSPGIHSYNASHITNEGILSQYGYIASRPHWVVRPAVWLDLGL